MMLQALPLVHFLSVLTWKEQMTTSVRKTLKTLLRSAQNRSISSEICLENNHKIGRFLLIAFWRRLPGNFLRNSHEIGRFFHKFVPKNPAKFDFFFCDLSEALNYKASPIASVNSGQNKLKPSQQNKTLILTGFFLFSVEFLIIAWGWGVK